MTNKPCDARALLAVIESEEHAESCGLEPCGEDCSCPAHECDCDRDYRIADALRAYLASAPQAGENAEGLSVICRECGTLTAGVEAGDRVMWVTCPVCFLRVPEEPNEK